jgi:hypothetical protein
MQARMMDNNAFAASSLDPYTRLLVGHPTRWCT